MPGKEISPFSQTGKKGGGGKWDNQCQKGHWQASSKRCGTHDFSEQPKVSGEYHDEKVLHHTEAPLILTPAKDAENKSVL